MGDIVFKKAMQTARKLDIYNEESAEAFERTFEKAVPPKPHGSPS
jgi:hypothetical protein